MSFPDLSLYKPTHDGTYIKLVDDSGPYIWDGSTMTLQATGGGGGSGGLTDTQLRATPVPVSNTQLPASLGTKTTANALAVSIASDDAQIGTKVTASPALGAGGTGIIGWLSQATDKLIAIIAQLPASLGIKTAAASFSIAPASDANIQRETYTTVTITSVQTNASGATYTAFATLACTQLDIVNNTGTTIEYRRGATGTAFQIPDGGSRLIQGITNASQIDVRRTDVSNTQVTAYAEGFVV
jgi:hypothetical protein